MSDQEARQEGATPVVPPTAAGNGGGKNGAPARTPAAGGEAVARRSFLPDIQFEMPPWIARYLQPRLPGLAVLFRRDAMLLVHVERGQRGAAPVVTHASQHALPDGSLTPGLTTANFSAPAEASARLGRALDALPNRRKLGNISLVLPDACARVILLDLASVPRGSRQLQQVVRWQVRKRVPFPLDEARLSMQRFPLPGGGEKVAVVLGMERVLSQYEQVVEALGLKPGLLDLATFNMANLCLLDPEAAREADAGDVAFLNMDDEEFSILILRQRVPWFYRSKPLLHRPDDAPDASLRDVQRELVTSAAYYRDRLEGDRRGIRRAWRRISGRPTLSLDRVVKETLNVEPRPVEVGGALTLPRSAAAGTDLLETLTPALGVTAGRWT